MGGEMDWKWKALPMDASLLPDLIPQGQVLGQITAEASEATGIPKGLPLVAAAADKACEVLGSGVLEPDVACLSYGTTATINTTHSKYIEVIPLLPPYPAAQPGRYNLEVQIYRGYWMISWFKHEFGLREVRIATERGVEPEILFDELVQAVPQVLRGWCSNHTGHQGCAIQDPRRAGPLSALVMCIPVLTSTALFWKGWPMLCDRGKNLLRRRVVFVLRA